MSGYPDSISNMDDLPPEIDPNFEPQTRIRSHTWPSRPTEFSVPPQDGETEPNCSPSAVSETDASEIKAHDAMGLKAKSSSRRNAWGNLSYADLITKAIQSSPSQRLTLSQIYDWMVQNVPYFKDKGDSNSSAGWKNSIRHNLSLHNRFMRIQNEGTGKSSWWVINPDAKPGKSPRRRATSMDTKAFEKKRGRAKKKVDQLRAAMEAGHSPSSPISETGDYSPLPAFTLSPSDFRPRASSNASSCGRLSPIPAIEPDLHDSQVPSMSPIPWGTDGMGSCGNLSYNSDYTDLTENFGDMMTLGEMTYKDSLGTLNEVSGMGSNSSIPQMMSGYDSYPVNEYDQYLPPPPYPSNTSPNVLQQQQQQQNGTTNIVTNGRTGNTYINLTTPQMEAYNQQQEMVRQDPMMNNPISSGNPIDAFRTINGVSQTRMSGGSVLTSSVYQNGRGMSPLVRPTPTQQPVSDSLLRAALTQKQVPFSSQAPAIQVNMYNHMNANSNMQSLNNYPGINSSGFQCYPGDFDLSLDSLQPEGLECDVNQVIQHELSVDGNLDFAFDPSTPSHNAVRLS